MTVIAIDGTFASGKGTLANASPGIMGWTILIPASSTVRPLMLSCKRAGMSAMPRKLPKRHEA